MSDQILAGRADKQKPIRKSLTAALSVSLLLPWLFACQSAPIDQEGRGRERAGAPATAPEPSLEPRLLAPSAIGDPLDALDQVRFGLLHAHTFFSDGSGTPQEAYARAKTQGLDFFAVTEHNHIAAEQGAKDRQDGILIAATPALYNSSAPITVTRRLIHGAQRVTVSSLMSSATSASSTGFVALYGQEFSTISSGNHVNVLGWDEVITVDAGDYKGLYETIAQAVVQGARIPVLQMNHPDVQADLFRPSTPVSQKKNDYGFDDYNEDFKSLVAAANEYLALIEILSGPALDPDTHPEYSYGSAHHERDYYFYLSQGFHLSPSVGQDNHYATWGNATPARMGVHASALDEDALYTAMRANRTYASEDSDLRVQFTVNGQPMGSVVTAEAGSPLRFSVALQDISDHHGTYAVTLTHGVVSPQNDVSLHKLDPRNGEVGTFMVNSPRTELHELKASGDPEFFYLRIQQKSDGDRVWTAPVWINHPRGRKLD